MRGAELLIPITLVQSSVDSKSLGLTRQRSSAAAFLLLRLSLCKLKRAQCAPDQLFFFSFLFHVALIA